MKLFSKSLLLTMISALSLFADSLDVAPDEITGLFADIRTNRGTITVQLEMDKTPLTVCNFVGLAEGKIANDKKELGVPYYNGLRFHRVIENFMIQGGDPLGTGAGGPGYQFDDEIDTSLTHFRSGTLSMANAGPGTNGSQFFITHGPTTHLDGKHTVFGYVTEGQDIVDMIQQNDIMASIYIRRLGAEAEAFTADQAMFDSLLTLQKDAQQAVINSANSEMIAKIEELYPNAIQANKGYFFVTTTEGEGDYPSDDSKVSIHFTGSFIDGEQFYTTVDRGYPFDVTLGTNDVVEGLNHALSSMKAGEKRTVILPPELAYGETGAGGMIPPNAWLVYDLELIEF